MKASCLSSGWRWGGGLSLVFALLLLQFAVFSRASLCVFFSFKNMKQFNPMQRETFSCSKMQIETHFPLPLPPPPPPSSLSLPFILHYRYCSSLFIILPPPPATTISVVALARLLSIRVSPRSQMCSWYDLFRGGKGGGFG